MNVEFFMASPEDAIIITFSRAEATFRVTQAKPLAVCADIVPTHCYLAHRDSYNRSVVKVVYLTVPP